jgi:predicted nucleotidyltransferase
MSYHINIVRLKSVANALGVLKDKVVFIGGATVCLYASRPLAVSIRPTDDVDVAIELISLSEFYKLQDHLLELGFKHDINSPIISRFLLEGLKVDFMPTDPSILGFSNQWYPEGLKYSIKYPLNEDVLISIFTSPYFIASKLEAFKTRGKSDLYWSHDLEDIIFVLDNRDTIEDELLNTDTKVKKYLQEEFTVLLKNDSFEEALTGHVEQSDQMNRKNRIIEILKNFVK